MTKKDFELIAKGIARRMDTSERERLVVIQVALSIATEIEMVNPKFNRHKFLTACGIDSDQTSVPVQPMYGQSPEAWHD